MPAMMHLALAPVMLLLHLAARSASAAASCEYAPVEGDRLLVRYSFTIDGETFHSDEINLVATVLGSPSVPERVNTALLGSCEGETVEAEIGATEWKAFVIAPDGQSSRWNFAYNSGGGGKGGKLMAAAAEAEGALASGEGAGEEMKVHFSIIVHHVTAIADDELNDAIRDGKNQSNMLRLVEARVGLNARDAQGATPLMSALQAKFQVVVAGLLNAWSPRVDVNAAKPTGHNALLYAIAANNLPIAKALLKRGADPNLGIVAPSDSAGWSPLHWAAKLELIKLVELLLEFGADPMAKTATGETVLDAAAGKDYSFRKKLAVALNGAVARQKAEAEAAGAAAGDGEF